MEKLGHGFTGHSDTEVVLHAFVQWREGCLERMNGIFAFALWIPEERRLFLARDRMGVKPLFYGENRGGLVFASEIKTILAYPGFPAELDREGVAQILLLGPGRIPGSGVLRGIRELEPGEYAWYDRGKLTKTRYWYLKDRIHEDDFPTTVERVRELVTDAIRGQMVSDMPLGCFLSGGLDSSIITAICAGERRKRGERLDTFSVDYANNDRYFVANKFQPNSDGHYIRTMVSFLDTDHHTTVLTPEDLADALEPATQARDLPGMGDVDFSLLAFCGKIRERVTVALSGECADEIFGGYPWYRDPAVRDLDGFPWAQNTALRVGFLSPEIRQRVNGEEFVREQYRQTLARCDILPENSPQEKRMKEMVNLNHRWFMQTLLDRKDRMSMYHGLEVRVPFCDYRIAEYLYAVPWEFKDYQGQEKGLLRQAMADLLPREVLWRKKSPYPKTYDPAYAACMAQGIRRMLEDPQAPIFQIVDPVALAELEGRDFTWPWYGQLMRGPQTMAYMLQINHWLKTYKISVI